MKRILSQEERNRKQKRNQLIIGIILVGIMIMGTVGYAFSDRTDNGIKKEKITYNEIEFVRGELYWTFSRYDYEFNTLYNPNETQGLDIKTTNFLQTYSNKPLYIVGNYREPISEISNNLAKFALKTQRACIDEENCTEDLPIKNCIDDNIIYFKEVQVNESEKVYQKNNCVVIEASDQNRTLYTDAFLFGLLRI
ncbi:MAG: hypothetical protein ACP5OG_01145 [Candidatus Nanoarchaeia archaeon]